MTSKYVFVGDRGEVLTPRPIIFSKFGQEVELEAAEAAHLVVDRHMPLIPADEFTATKNATDPKLEARIALHHHREKIASPASQVAVSTSPAIPSHQPEAVEEQS